jgi:hypothetical protein
MIRWSPHAWEALYPDIHAHWWKPWPHEDELRQRNRQANLDLFQVPQSLRNAWKTIDAEFARN